MKIMISDVCIIVYSLHLILIHQLTKTVHKNIEKHQINTENNGKNIHFICFTAITQNIIIFWKQYEIWTNSLCRVDWIYIFLISNLEFCIKICFHFFLLLTKCLPGKFVPVFLHWGSSLLLMKFVAVIKSRRNLVTLHTSFVLFTQGAPSDFQLQRSSSVINDWYTWYVEWNVVSYF